MAMTMTLDECLSHIPKKLTPEIEKFAIDVVFKYQRYIFTTRQGKQQYGYCTYCQNDFPTTGLRHNKIATYIILIGYISTGYNI